MAGSKEIKRILWAVDPLEKHTELESCVVRVLQEVTRATAASIQPVFVLNADHLNISSELLTADWIRHYQPVFEKTLQQMLQGVSLPRLLETKVLADTGLTLSTAVKVLSTYAETTFADLIVTGTHARKGLSRWALGSFAETLLTHSKVPVLVVNPETQARGSLRKILFATDFTEKSLLAFQRVIDWAQSLKASLVITHCLRRPIEPVIQSGVYLLAGGWVSFPEFSVEERRTVENRLVEYESLARKQGIDAVTRVCIDSVSVPQSVVEMARNEEADLIAMAAESGPVASALLGSIARQVVRNSEMPVLLLRTQQ